MRLRALASLSLMALGAIPALLHAAVLPLVFEPDSGGGFVGRHAGGPVAIRREGVDLGTVRMRLAGVDRRASVEALEPLPGKSYYYVGNDPQRWRTGVAQYGKVAYRGVYPGVDLVFYGNGNNLEYDLTLAAHADLGRVRLRFDGARQLAVDENGDLRIESRDGVLLQKKPVVWQEDRGSRRAVAARYVVAGREVRFEVPGYDASQRLVIDPAIIYATYLGGVKDDTPGGIASDTAGNVYITGNTQSIDFPQYPTSNRLIKTPPSVFVAKLDPTGKHLLYSVVMSGTGYDSATAIAVDPAGNAYITGASSSTDFPMRNAYQSTRQGGWDAIVIKLDPAGNLMYSTYLGGAQMQPCKCSDPNWGPATALDYGTAILADASGNAYVAGTTYSADFPYTIGQLSHTPNNGEGFVIGFSPTGTMTFSTLIGGSDNDEATAIAFGAGGTLWVAGRTSSTDLPVTAGAIQLRYAGAGGHSGRKYGTGDGWLAKINPAAVSSRFMIGLTYLGGSQDETITSIRPDAADNLYVVGQTLSQNFPVTPGAYQATFGGGTDWGDGFVVKTNSILTSELFGTYFGGGGEDSIGQMTLDALGQVWMVGMAGGDLTPASLGANPGALLPYSTAPLPFLLQLDTTGRSVVSFTYLGTWLGAAPGLTVAQMGLAFDGTGRLNVIVPATVTSPVLGAGALQTKPLGGVELSVMKLDMTPLPAILSVVNGASMTAALAPGSLAIVTGTNLPALASAGAKVGGRDAQVVSASPTQWTIVIPGYLDIGGASVQIGNSLTVNVTLAAYAPALFSTTNDGKGIVQGVRAAIAGGASTPISAANPALPGDTVTIYGTGFDAATTGNTVLMVGFVQVPAAQTGAVSSTPGTDQVTFLLPPGTVAGNLNVAVTVGGQVSNTLTLPVGVTVVPPPAIASVQNGASFQDGFAANAYLTIKGTNLAMVAADSWDKSIVGGQLPTSLDGVTVTVGGKAAYISYVSPGQINAVAPDVAAGTAQVVVKTSAGTSTAFASTAQVYQPAMFLSQGHVVASHYPDYSFASTARPGEVIILWGTGFGPTTPLAPVGAVVPSGTAYPTATPVKVTIGGVSATVYGAALASGFAALYQVAIEVPDSLADGDYPLVATVNGVASPAGAAITVKK